MRGLVQLLYIKSGFIIPVVGLFYHYCYVRQHSSTMDINDIWDFIFFYRKLLKGPELTVNLPRAKTKQNKGYFHIACKERGRGTQATFTGHQTDRLKNLSGIFVYTEPFDINFFSLCSHGTDESGCSLTVVSGFAICSCADGAS